MSRLSELIRKLCPDGVEYRKLDELGKFYGGITGKSKDDFKDGNAVFITYKNVYANPALDITPEDRVKISESEKQRTLEYGDIIFTGSSETPDECGFSSVVTQRPTEKLYLNSFCFFFRLDDLSILEPDFAKHIFRSHDLRRQISRTASGVTRFNVSKDKMKKVKIPVPPLEVQREIVRILDSFTLLTAELTARQQQYKYYSKYLLCHAEGAVDTPIEELGKWQGGKTPSMANPDYWNNGSIPWISSKDMKVAVLEDTQDHITNEAISNGGMKLLPAGVTAIVTRSGILKHTFPVAYVPVPCTINQDIKALIVKEDVDSRFAALAIQAFSDGIRVATKKQGGTVDSLEFGKILSFKIPVPPLDEQLRVVQTLDRFDSICNDIASGIPAEIEARQKQYEYYRDKLLTFKEKEA